MNAFRWTLPPGGTSIEWLLPHQWGDACDRAFRDIKVLLSSEPVLTLPNQSDPFILAVDFSYDGMGLVFS